MVQGPYRSGTFGRSQGIFVYAEKEAENISKPPKSKSFASCSTQEGREGGSPWQVNKGPRGKTPSERCWFTYWISLVCWRSSCLPLDIVYLRVSDWFIARIRRIHNVAFCSRVTVAPFSKIYPVDFRLRTLHIHPMSSHSFMMTALDLQIIL